MFTVNKINNMLNNHESGLADPLTFKTIFSIHRERFKFFLANKNAIPTHEHLIEAAEYILFSTGVVLNTEEIEAILSLFPQTRILLAVYEGCDDSEVRDAIYDTVCNFFVGSDAPIIKDNIDINRFIQFLQFQAKAMGYRVEESTDSLPSITKANY